MPHTMSYNWNNWTKNKEFSVFFHLCWVQWPGVMIHLQPATYQCHDTHSLHVSSRTPRIKFRGGVTTRRGGGGQGGGCGWGSDRGPVVVHSGQVKTIQADTGDTVLNLLCSKLRGLLLLLYEAGRQQETESKKRVDIWLFTTYSFKRITSY